MIEIISGTDRPHSNSVKIANKIVADYRALGAQADLIDLNKLNLSDVQGGPYFNGAQGTYAEAVRRVTAAEGLVLVVPEYNGSYPGALKLFIDYWRYPDSFENRPVALVGIGARWGGLRPIEHLQQVFGYRNAFVFPNRVFITHVKDIFKDGDITDPLIAELLQVQSRDFLKYILALESQGLDANSRLKQKK